MSTDGISHSKSSRKDRRFSNEHFDAQIQEHRNSMQELLESWAEKQERLVQRFEAHDQILQNFIQRLVCVDYSGYEDVPEGTDHRVSQVALPHPLDDQETDSESREKITAIDEQVMPITLKVFSEEAVHGTVDELVKERGVSLSQELNLDESQTGRSERRTSKQHEFMALEPLDELKYDVRNFYYTDGIAQKVARSDVFANVTLGVIAINALYLSIDTELNDAESLATAHWVFIVCENLFCIFFFAELIVRFAAFKRKINAMKDGWFKFDLVLVSLYVFDCWVVPALVSLGGGVSALPTGPLRLLRLLRLSRLFRLMRAFPELLTMVKGMHVAVRALSASLTMLCGFLYVYAIVFMILLKDEEDLDDFFSTFPRTVWTLLLFGTFMDGTGELTGAMFEVNTATAYIAVVIFLTFVFFSSVTIMNMLIGVLCEVVGAVAAYEKDAAALDDLKDSILTELLKFDEDETGTLSKEELDKVMNCKTCAEVLKHLDVDVEYVKELQALLFMQTEEVQIDTVMEMLLHSRGDLPTTVKHMTSHLAFTRWVNEIHMKELQHNIENFVAERTQLISPEVVGSSFPCGIASTSLTRTSDLVKELGANGRKPMAMTNGTPCLNPPMLGINGSTSTYPPTSPEFAMPAAPSRRSSQTKKKKETRSSKSSESNGEKIDQKAPSSQADMAEDNVLTPLAKAVDQHAMSPRTEKVEEKASTSQAKRVDQNPMLSQAPAVEWGAHVEEKAPASQAKRTDQNPMPSQAREVEKKTMPHLLARKADQTIIMSDDSDTDAPQSP